MSSRSADKNPSPGPLDGAASFAAEVARAIVAARLEDDAVCIAHLGIDGLDRLREQHGAGRVDALLAEVGGALARSIRGGDVVARLGADTFGLVLHHCELDILDIVATRLLGQVTRLAQSNPGLDLSACLGVAYFSDPPAGDDHAAVAETTQIAGQALDEARIQGAGKLVVRAR